MRAGQRVNLRVPRSVVVRGARERPLVTRSFPPVLARIWHAASGQHLIRSKIPAHPDQSVVVRQACSQGPQAAAWPSCIQGYPQLLLANPLARSVRSGRQRYAINVQLARVKRSQSRLLLGVEGGCDLGGYVLARRQAHNILENLRIAPLGDRRPALRHALDGLMARQDPVSYTPLGSKSTGSFKGATGSGKVVLTFQAETELKGKCSTANNAEPVSLTGAYGEFAGSGPLTVPSGS